MEITTLVNSLKQQIEAECRQVRQVTRQEIEALTEKAKTEGQREGEKEAQLIWQKAKEEEELLKNKLLLELEKKKLELRQSFLAQVKQQAQEELVKFTQSEAWAAWFRENLEKALAVAKKEKGEVCVHPADADLAREACKNYPAFTVSANKQLPKGSLVIKTASFTVNNSLLKRLENCWQQHFSQIAEVLFNDKQL
jgi:vacuolar-type H+-ATPase subunit E/Vma4